MFNGTNTKSDQHDFQAVKSVIYDHLFVRKLLTVK